MTRYILDSLPLQTRWQKQWREILGEPTSDMPEDIRSDFALHIDIWGLSEGKQEECFSLFPNGMKILEKASEVRAIERKKFEGDESKLIGYLEELNSSVKKVLAMASDQYAIDLNNQKDRCKEISVYHGEEKQRLEYFTNAMDPTLPLDDILRDLFEKQFGLEGYSAYEFLSEPLYRVSHNTVIAGGILWAALQDEYEVDPYFSVIELYKVFAQAGWNKHDDEIFVFVKQ